MFDINKLKNEQIKLSKKVITKDSFEKADTIAGVDFSYSKSHCVCAIVACKINSMEILEKVSLRKKLDFPYIKGFLAYRLGKITIETYLKMQGKPDILLIPGHGISHPRRFGFASHIGVSLDTVTIGVAKEMLFGEEKSGVVYIDKIPSAKAIVTKENARPLYISPGHRISLNTSADIIKKCMRFPHKSPEPLHLAHGEAKSILELSINPS